MRRALDAVLLSALVCACDAGTFGSHSDRGPVGLVFTAQPAAAAVGEAIGPVAVTVQDAYGNTVSSAHADITIAIGTNPGGATLSGITTRAATGGVAVFSDLAFDRGGSGYTLTAEASGLASATSGPIEVRGPVKLAFIAQPAAALAGAAMRPVVVAVQDNDGNNMPNAHATITVAIGTNPGGGALSGTTTLPAVGGVAVFSDLVINNPGPGYTLSATSSGLMTATSGPIEVDVTPPATQVAFSAQPGRGWQLVNEALSPAVQVSILDDLYNVVTSSTMDVTVAIATGPAGATLSGRSTVAAVNGVATFTDLSIDIPGVYTLAASACSLTGTSAPFEIRGKLYVVNDVDNGGGPLPVSITAYTPGATGDVAPIATIAGDSTRLNHPQGIAVDAAGRVYVAIALSLGSIVIYGAGASGNTPPLATIEGSNTGLELPYAIALDAAGQLYVTNTNPNAPPPGSYWITVYAAGATGNAAPIATIQGSNTGLDNPLGIALDASGRLYAANVDGSITVYAPGATGNVAPIATIVGEGRNLSAIPGGIAVDGSGKVYVSRYIACGYGFDPFSQRILVYAAGATGNATPIATIQGDNTGLDGPHGLAVSGAGRLYVANATVCPGMMAPPGFGSITVYAPGATGNVAPIATIAGSTTGLAGPTWLAFAP